MFIMTSMCLNNLFFKKSISKFNLFFELKRLIFVVPKVVIELVEQILTD